jgi:hypothetical protein
MMNRQAQLNGIGIYSQVKVFWFVVLMLYYQRLKSRKY